MQTISLAVEFLVDHIEDEALRERVLSLLDAESHRFAAQVLDALEENGIDGFTVHLE